MRGFIHKKAYTEFRIPQELMEIETVLIIGDRRVQVVELSIGEPGSDQAGHVINEPHTSLDFRCRRCL